MTTITVISIAMVAGIAAGTLWFGICHRLFQANRFGKLILTTPQ